MRLSWGGREIKLGLRLLDQGLAAGGPRLGGNVTLWVHSAATLPSTSVLYGQRTVCCCCTEPPVHHGQYHPPYPTDAAARRPCGLAPSSAMPCTPP